MPSMQTYQMSLSQTYVYEVYRTPVAAYRRFMDERAIYVTLGEAMLVRRRRLGLTQAAIAKKVGVSRESIANIEAGRQRVLLHHVYGLVRALDLKAITDLIPATPPRDLGGSGMGVELSGATVSNSQRSEIERLLSQALGDRAAGSTS